MQMIGSIVMIVAAALTDVGVTVPLEFFIASADELWFVTDESSFISSY